MRYEDWTPVEKEIIGNEVHYKLNMVQNLPPPTYINPDEVYFADANRPRDQHWFPIQPGQQMGKWDWRGSMKNTYLDQYVARWAKIITGKKPFNLQNDLVQIPLNFNNSGKLSFVNEFTLYWGWKIPQSDFENMSKWSKIWKLWWSDYNGRIKIPVSWSYFINYYVEFFHWTRYTLDNMEKIYAELQRFSKTWELLWKMDNSVTRSCMSVDKCWGITIQDLKAGESIWLWALHANNGKDALCWGTIIVMKLS